MHVTLLILNAVVSLASAGWALVALIRPVRFSGSVTPTPGERLFARLYAARSIPLGLTAAALPALAHGTSVFLVLLAAAAVQALDVSIGFQAGKRDMVTGAALASLVHVACAFAS